MTRLLRRLARDGSGATSIEYCLFAVLIGLAVMGTIKVLFSDGVTGLYSGMANRILAALGAA